MKHPGGSWMLGEEHRLYNAITYWDTISVLHLVSSKYRISHPWRVIIFHEGRKWVIKVFLRSKTGIRIFINVRNNLLEVFCCGFFSVVVLCCSGVYFVGGSVYLFVCLFWDYFTHSNIFSFSRNQQLFF